MDGTNDYMDKKIMKINIFIKTVFISLFVITALLACQSNELTAEEIAIQNAADAEVSSILFEHDLDNHTSYNVHKDGSVIIKFDKSVSSSAYTSVVNILRTKKDINGVYAKQSGYEVCPLKSIR
ncbi:MAG: hypothetical protein GY694_07470 [Gammaproteobacteria bacterium]|nr:hypothetical protein [Gammaproteobacteria bacterium]